jgi:hypothetical protein
MCYIKGMKTTFPGSRIVRQNVPAAVTDTGSRDDGPPGRSKYGRRGKQVIAISVEPLPGQTVIVTSLDTKLSNSTRKPHKRKLTTDTLPPGFGPPILISDLISDQVLSEVENNIKIDHNITMDQAAILHAAAEILRGGFPAERVERALAPLGYLEAAEVEHEMIDRAPAEPRAENTDAKRTAKQLFGVAASGATRRYHKSDEPEFTEEELTDPDLLKAADKAGNDRRSREGKGEVLSQEEMEATLRAGRFAKKARERQTLSP